MDVAVDMYHTLRDMRKRQVTRGRSLATKHTCSGQNARAAPACGTRAMIRTAEPLRHARSQLAHQVLNLSMIVCSALMIWKSLMVVTSSESPVVVVLSGRCGALRRCRRAAACRREGAQ